MRIALPAVLALIALLAIMQGSASASSPPEWRLGRAVLTESVGTEWAPATIKFRDSTWPGGSNERTTECNSTGGGSINVESHGEITRWENSACTGLDVNCEANTVKLEPLHLPWHTELSVVGGVLRESIVNGGNGDPGFLEKCKVLGITLSDQCTGPIVAETANTTSGVTATFLAAEKLTCGSAPTGEVEGSHPINAEQKGKLSAVTPTEAAKLDEAEWRINGEPILEPKGVTFKGTIAVGEHMECEDKAEGTVGVNRASVQNVGEVKSGWTISNCKTAGLCESGAAMTLEPIDLPWRTELAHVESWIDDVMVGDGKGLPGFKYSCHVHGVSVEGTCTGALSTTATNFSEFGDVSLGFDASETPYCGGSEYMRGTQTVNTKSGPSIETRT